MECVPRKCFTKRKKKKISPSCLCLNSVLQCFKMHRDFKVRRPCARNDSLCFDIPYPFLKFWHVLDYDSQMGCGGVDTNGCVLGREKIRKLESQQFSGTGKVVSRQRCGRERRRRRSVDSHAVQEASLYQNQPPPWNPRRARGNWWNEQEGLIKASQLKRIDVLHILSYCSIGLPGWSCCSYWVQPNKLNK